MVVHFLLSRQLRVLNGLLMHLRLLVLGNLRLGRLHLEGLLVRLVHYSELVLILVYEAKRRCSLFLLVELLLHLRLSLSDSVADLLLLVRNMLRLHLLLLLRAINMRRVLLVLNTSGAHLSLPDLLLDLLHAVLLQCHSIHCNRGGLLLLRHRLLGL